MTKFTTTILYNGEEKNIEIDDSIFRAYDIRGIADKSGSEAVTLTPDVAYAIGQAVGTEVLLARQTRTIIGRDARNSSDALSNALIQGVLSTGCHVVNIGRVPTPVVHYSIDHLNISSAVTITASHNPGHHNGIKVVINHETLAADRITALLNRIKSKEIHESSGKETFYNDILENYLERVTKSLSASRRLKVVIDPLHGMTALIAERLFKQLGCEVIMLHSEVLANFGGLEADPAQPRNLETLRSKVIAEKADIGFGFDGDGDRVGIITNTGEFIAADRILMLLAANIIKKDEKTPVIFDVKCSKDLATVILTQGGTPRMSRTGRSFILQEMQKDSSILLGGEKSGHIFLSKAEGGTGYDDGLLIASKVLLILANQPKSIAELFDSFPKSIGTPELSVQFATDDEKLDLMKKIENQARFEDAKQIITIDGLRVEYEEGWGLVRPSNTSAKLVFVFEANSEKALQEVQQRFADQVLKINPDLKLPFKHAIASHEPAGEKVAMSFCP